MRGAGSVSSGVNLPTIPPLSGTRSRPVAAWDGPLPYPIVIADRRNNRLIEVAPNKQIVWEFASPNLSVYRGNDDVFFSPDGRKLVVNEEDNYDIHMNAPIFWNQPSTSDAPPAGRFMKPPKLQRRRAIAT